MCERRHPRSPARFLLVALLSLALSPFAAAAPSSRVQGPESNRLQELRRRWAEKSEAERSELVQRFRKLQELSAEDRELFLSLGQRLHEAKYGDNDLGVDDGDGTLGEGGLEGDVDQIDLKKLDVKEEQLAEAKAALSGGSGTIIAKVCDVSDPNAMTALPCTGRFL